MNLTFSMATKFILLRWPKISYSCFSRIRSNGITWNARCFTKAQTLSSVKCNYITVVFTIWIVFNEEPDFKSLWITVIFSRNVFTFKGLDEFQCATANMIPYALQCKISAQSIMEMKYEHDLKCTPAYSYNVHLKMQYISSEKSHRNKNVSKSVSHDYRGYQTLYTFEIRVQSSRSFLLAFSKQSATGGHSLFIRSCCSDMLSFSCMVFYRCSSALLKKDKRTIVNPVEKGLWSQCNWTWPQAARNNEWCTQLSYAVSFTFQKT